MWSGPRNISTTLLRSWGARPDTFVCDEPLYAHYLLRSGAPHPGREQVIASHETDWRRVVDQLTGPVPGGKPVFYQKHMAKHLLPEVGRDWLERLSHAFLIREPAEMLASFARVVPDPTLADTGLPLQCELFEQVADRTGQAPPVIDSRDVLEDPAGVLARLCEALDVPYTDAMLSWPAGRRDTDGVWAPHWYASVEASTGFAAPGPRLARPPGGMERLYEQCLPWYERLAAHRLRA
jgi:Sulfotransferase domain